jgi:hypothetical protein
MQDIWKTPENLERQQVAYDAWLRQNGQEPYSFTPEMTNATPRYVYVVPDEEDEEYDEDDYDEENDNYRPF